LLWLQLRRLPPAVPERLEPVFAVKVEVLSRLQLPSKVLADFMNANLT
jgi:hypothetical protein